MEPGAGQVLAEHSKQQARGHPVHMCGAEGSVGVLQDIEAFIKADPYVKADLVSSWYGYLPWQPNLSMHLHK